MTVAARAPIWSIAHGGPPTLFDTAHKAHQAWRDVGRAIVASGARGLVVVSAHWEAEQPGTLLVNEQQNPAQIYDFYNFPKHYYDQRFNTETPGWLSDAVVQQLSASSSLKPQRVQRGPDHGIWVPLKAAFGDAAPLPLVQVSLPAPTGDDAADARAALALGEALRGLRDQGIAVLGSGQPVHNLRDAFGRGSNDVSYGGPFLRAHSEALLGDGHARWAAAEALTRRTDFRKAHPTAEHFLPALVALGAAHDAERATELLQLDEGALGWGMYQW